MTDWKRWQMNKCEIFASIYEGKSLHLALYRVVHDRGVYPGRQVDTDDEDPSLEEVDGLGGVQPATVARGTEQAGTDFGFK